MKQPQKVPPPHIPVSWGELLDKITILDIKRERLTGEEALANVGRELQILRTIAEPVLAVDQTAQIQLQQLKTLNEILWDIEDRIRDMEAKGQFDAAFIELARSVYKRNDERGALKKKISQHLASEVIEEKGYKPY